MPQNFPFFAAPYQKPCPDAAPLHIEHPSVDDNNPDVNLGDFNPKFKGIPVPIPGLVIPIPGGSGDDKIEVLTLKFIGTTAG